MTRRNGTLYRKYAAFIDHLAEWPSGVALYRVFTVLIFCYLCFTVQVTDANTSTIVPPSLCHGLWNALIGSSQIAGNGEHDRSPPPVHASHLAYRNDTQNLNAPENIIGLAFT